MGVGIPNSFRLKPILNARIPLNSSFTSLIRLHNPYNFSLQVLEIYTSDDDLHLELPPHIESTLRSTVGKESRHTNELDSQTIKSSNKIKQTSSFLNKEYHASTISNKTDWVISSWQLEWFPKNVEKLLPVKILHWRRSRIFIYRNK